MPLDVVVDKMVEALSVEMCLPYMLAISIKLVYVPKARAIMPKTMIKKLRSSSLRSECTSQ